MSDGTGSNRTRAGRRLLAGALSVGALAATGVSVGGPAAAAVPDRFGFVLYSGGAVVGSGTTPAGTTVGVIGTGQYKITFVGAARDGGVVHVTAINSAPHWCQVNGFGPSGTDEVVTISCHRVGGAPDFTDFSAIFSASSGPASAGAFGYVNSLPSGALVSQYNSAVLGNTVIHLSTGQWSVKFPGLSTPGPIDGSLQATAVSPPTVPARCKVLSWTSATSGQVAQVNCYDAGGVPADTQFTLTYQYQRSLYGGAIPPKYFGYLWNKPVGGPVSTNFNSIAGPGTNTLSAGTLSLVTFPKIGVLPDDIQVTGSGPGSDFCGLNFTWTHAGTDTIVRDVNCFTNAGAPSAAGFLISDNSAL